MSLTSFGVVANSLRARGFKQVRPEIAGAKAFRGELSCRGQQVGIRLEIADWDFVSYPSIFVESAPEVLKGFRTHVQSGGGLCYYLGGSVLLNRFKPAEAVARCLVRAEETLEEMANQRDFQFQVQDEFGLYWMEQLVYVGRLDPADKRAHLIRIESPQQKFFVLTHTEEESKWIARATGGEIKRRLPAWFIETQNRPSIDVNVGLPSTIKEAMEWVKRWDPTASQRLISLLETRDFLQDEFATIVFNSPVGPFGFILEINPQRATAYRRKPAQYRQYLHGAGGRTSIARFYAADISAEFVHSRNLAGKSLMGRKISIIGCGAIGGYIAHAFVRLGAGVGAGGQMTLIDLDQVQPGNLGRHILGFPALHRSKADALKDELKNQFPYANINAYEGDVRSYAKLFNNDLIVDATGEESLAIALAQTHQAHLRARGTPPLLHVWISGNGEATQALFVDGKKGGCYRCMWTDEPKIGMKERIPLLKKPPSTKHVGCQSVTMFPVSAAMSAAALASDLVIDWLDGDPSPRFRTRARENADLFRASPQDLSRLRNCPACKRT